ncbi:cyclic nucleotide-gated channel rod photoreceptor subunit alpha-like [Pectinophora gossypiella]|uniref:cyclic nucleotide-gated channel rod photoreceptor subunit alpha-like n=1 Tax=Pectinophora gossypiella TaxID=13191 RepID=UPI00214F3769|nr:cyclic nucleotide-gated channel rod photoreceptor subunit alpha-like [Pectinophora gossypiella]
MRVIEKLNELYQLLPTCIIKEIKINSYYRYVKRIPYFAEWPSEVVEDLVILLREEVYLEEDIVAPKWSQGEGLMILHVGMLAVYNAEQKEVGHLIDGDYFGELSLVTDREVRTSEVVAITPCKTNPKIVRISRIDRYSSAFNTDELDQ